jgi:MFS family permease
MSAASSVVTAGAGLSAAPRRRLTKVILAVSAATYTMLQSMLFPVLPTLQAALHTSQSAVTWVLTAYLVSAAVCTPVLGRLGDRYGKKRMFIVALVALAGGSLLAATATALPTMVAARAIQGAGGGVLPLSFGIAQDQLPAREVPGTIGLISMLSGVGSGLGIVLAGPVIALLGFHWLFWIPFVPTAAAALATSFVLSESPRDRSGTLRWQAFVLLAAWLIALLLAISEGSQWGWRSAGVIGLFAAAAVTIVAWVIVESRSDTPLIDMTMMRLRGVWSNNLVTLLLGMCMFAALSFTAELVQAPKSTGYGFGASVTEAGVILTPQAVASVILGAALGPLIARAGPKRILLWGALACTTAMTAEGLVHGAPWQIELIMLVLGAGTITLVGAQSAISVTVVPRQQTGVSAGMNANIRQIGGSIGAALMGSIVTSTAGPGGLPTATGYADGFFALAAAAGAGAVMSLFVPSARRAAPEPAPELESA